ncbi:uncharacterized protein LOC144652641 [Oculina patagonica]
MESGTHLLLFLLFLGMTNTEALAEEDSPSSRSAFFVTKENKRLKGHVVKRFESPSFLSCSQKCMRNEWCTSTNFKLSSRNNGKGTCKLLNASSFIDGREFQDEKGVTFARLFKDPCQTNPCQNIGDCVPDFALSLVQAMVLAFMLTPVIDPSTSSAITVRKLRRVALKEIYSTEK